MHIGFSNKSRSTVMLYSGSPQADQLLHTANRSSEAHDKSAWGLFFLTFANGICIQLSSEEAMYQEQPPGSANEHCTRDYWQR